MQFTPDQPVTIVVTCHINENHFNALRGLGFRRNDVEIGMPGGDHGHSEVWKEFAKNGASVLIPENARQAVAMADRSFPDVILFSTDRRGDLMRKVILNRGFFLDRSVDPHESVVDVIMEISRSTPNERRQMMKAASGRSIEASLA